MTSAAIKTGDMLGSQLAEISRDLGESDDFRGIQVSTKDALAESIVMKRSGNTRIQRFGDSVFPSSDR